MMTTNCPDDIDPADLGAGVIDDYIDPDPILSTPQAVIQDSTVTEGNAGNTSAHVTVGVTIPPIGACAVDWATSSGGGATAVAGVDYVAASGTLNFIAGDTEKVITIQIIGNTMVQGARYFFINLSNPSGMGISDTTARVTISDDDTTPGGPPSQFSIFPAYKHVGNQGSEGTCGGFSGAYMMTAQFYQRSQGGVRNFDPIRLYLEAGGNGAHTSGVAAATVLGKLKANGALSTAGYGRYKLSSYWAMSASNWYNQLKDQIGVKHRPVYMRCDYKNAWKCANNGTLNNAGQGSCVGAGGVFGHIIFIVAYNDNFQTGGETVPAIKIQNSWGSGWGKGGQAWMPVSYVDTVNNSILVTGKEFQFWACQITPGLGWQP